MRDSRFWQKFQPPDAQWLAHAWLTRSAETPATPDLGLSRIFRNFQTPSKRPQTQGGYTTRCQKRFETESFFWTRGVLMLAIAGGSAGGSKVGSDLVKFSHIFQLLHRALKLKERVCLGVRNTARDSSFHQKIQPDGAQWLPHAGLTRSAETSATPDLGLSEIFKKNPTSTQSSQTRGACLPRHQKHFER